MKVLHIFNELLPSGAETMVQCAAPVWLPEAEMHVLSTGATVGSFAEQLEVAGFRIHHIPFAKRPTFFVRIARLLRQERFDVIHIHTERASFWYALTGRLALGERPLVVRTIHHIFFFRGWLRFRRLLGRQLMRWPLRTTFVANSPSGRRNEAWRFKVGAVLIPNWYDSDRYALTRNAERNGTRSSLGFGADTCVFLSVGGNESYKNYKSILEALVLVPAELCVLYVQVGRQGDGAPLEAAAAELSVSHRLRCEGVVPDPLPYLQAADAFLMPSFDEGFGVAAVEAMATGLPAILSDVEALCDFRDTVDGITWVTPHPAGIATAMTSIATMSIGDRRLAGRKAAAGVLRHYGLGTGPYQYLDLYRRNVPDRRRRRFKALGH